MLKYFKGKYRI